MPALPFRAELLAGPRAAPVLPPRLAAHLSLAGSLAEPRGIAATDGDDTRAWEAFHGELAAFERGLELVQDPVGEAERSPLELSGFLRTSLESNWENRWPEADRISRGASLDNARLVLDGRVGPLNVHLSVEGSTDGGRQYLVHAGEAGELEVLDAYADLRLLERLTLRAGQFRAPVTFAAQLDENELLFLDRTVVSQRWVERETGAALYARGDRLEAWLAVHNGSDETADEFAFTARGVLRLFGEGEAPRREGAYDADLGETLYLGAAWHEDRSLDDARVLVAEAHYSFEAFAVSGEFQSPQDGFQGGADFWNVTASAMLVPEQWELAARYEDLRDRAGARVWRLGLVRYLRGADTKLQLGVTRLEHSDSHLDLSSLDLTLVASF
ncbi:MAG TPA: hypothetical protein VMT18_07285 [Planctomycetota bacterium]|nr:hypothetical protein [Planctomycetota bacterium]